MVPRGPEASVESRAQGFKAPLTPGAHHLEQVLLPHLLRHLGRPHLQHAGRPPERRAPRQRGVDPVAEVVLGPRRLEPHHHAGVPNAPDAPAQQQRADARREAAREVVDFETFPSVLRPLLWRCCRSVAGERAGLHWMWTSCERSETNADCFLQAAVAPHSPWSCTRVLGAAPSAPSSSPDEGSSTASGCAASAIRGPGPGAGSVGQRLGAGGGKSGRVWWVGLVGRVWSGGSGWGEPLPSPGCCWSPLPSHGPPRPGGLQAGPASPRAAGAARGAFCAWKKGGAEASVSVSVGEAAPPRQHQHPSASLH